MATFYSQYASGVQFTAGTIVGSVLGESGLNPIVDRLNSISTNNNLVTGSLISGTATIIYSTNLQLSTSIDVANGLREGLGLGSVQFINKHFNFAPGNNLLGSTNMINQGGSIFPFFSADSNFTSNTLDEFNDSVVGSIWGSVVVLGANSSFTVTEDTTKLMIKANINGAAGVSSYDGSVFFSGTSLNNMFNSFGGYIRFRLGSVAAGGPAFGSLAMIFNQQTIFNKTAAFNTSGILVDLMRMGSNNFYYRKNEGTSWEAWQGTFSTGSPSVLFYLQCATEGNAANNGSIFIDWSRVLSGTRNIEFIYSGLALPGGGSTSYYTSTNLGQTVLTMHGEGNYESGANLDLSLNRGINYNTGSFNRWTNITNPGSTLTVRYTQSGTWYSGLHTGVVISRIAAQFY